VLGCVGAAVFCHPYWQARHLCRNSTLHPFRRNRLCRFWRTSFRPRCARTSRRMHGLLRVPGSKPSAGRLGLGSRACRWPDPICRGSKMGKPGCFLHHRHDALCDGNKHRRLLCCPRTAPAGNRDAVEQRPVTRQPASKLGLPQGSEISFFAAIVFCDSEHGKRVPRGERCDRSIKDRENLRVEER
jgi:hypothetical protein